MPVLPRRFRPFLALFVFAACEQQQDTLLEPENPLPSVMAQQSTAATRWSKLSDDELFRHVAHFDSTVIVLLAHPGKGIGIVRGHVTLDSLRWEAAVRGVSHLPGVTLLARDRYIPGVKLGVNSAAAVSRLRASPFVATVEPDKFETTPGTPGTLQSGCSEGAEGEWSAPLRYVDGDAVPWSFAQQYTQVEDAWRRSTGDNVRIGLIEHGAGSQQLGAR